MESLRAVLDESSSRSVVVLHTIVDVALHRKVEGLLDSRCIPIIDVIGPALDALSMVLGQSPSQRVGAVHPSKVYFDRPRIPGSPGIPIAGLSRCSPMLFLVSMRTC